MVHEHFFDNIEVGTAVLGLICLGAYATVIPDERIIMIALAMLSAAVGIEQSQRRKNNG